MRYIVKYIDYSIYAVIDTEAPESVCGDKSQGHALLFTHNGREPVQIAADALNARVKKITSHNVDYTKSAPACPHWSKRGVCTESGSLCDGCGADIA